MVWLSESSDDALMRVLSETNAEAAAVKQIYYTEYKTYLRHLLFVKDLWARTKTPYRLGEVKLICRLNKLNVC